MKYLLGIDIGTSATKTVLFNQNGDVIISKSIEYPLYQPKNGYAEQNPIDWWNACRDTIKYVVQNSGIEPIDIVSIGLAGQMHGLVMLGNDGGVLRNAIIWCDQRTESECREITSKVGGKRLIEITANPALTGFTASKILWVKNNEPEVYKKCRHILLPKDYIRYKLGGVFASDVSDASGTGLLDIHTRDWSLEILEKLDIDKGMLAKVYESIEVTGHTTKEIQEQTGLYPGTIIVAGAGDNASAAVGTGVVSDGEAFTTIGSSGVVFAHSSSINIDAKGRVHTFCCAVPGQYHLMGVTQAAGLSLKWYRDTFCDKELEIANNEKIDIYELITKDVGNISIGCDKLIYLPYLMGERTPHLDPNCRGVLFGLSASHTKEHITRAIMEGVSYSLLDCVNIFRSMGIIIDDMILCGGGAHSTTWRQMLADLYECRVKTINSKEGPALGAAILAGVGAGIFETVQDACLNIIKFSKQQDNIQSNTQEYKKYYKIYGNLYNNLKNTYIDIAQL